MSTEFVILAGGQGTRMRSSLPKVLHEVGGRPLLAHVLSTVKDLGSEKIHVVVGAGRDLVCERFEGAAVNWVVQEEQRGTGHAVAQALPHIDPQCAVIVLYGDVPMVRGSTLQALAKAASAGELAIVTARVTDPSGLGRIVRDGEGRMRTIVEERDADRSQLEIDEINGGIMGAPASLFHRWVPELRPANAQQEYYLTDLVRLASRDGVAIQTVHPEFEEEVWGVNSRQELARLERAYQRRAAESLMCEGATLRDPARLDVRGEISVGEDVQIDVNVVLEGTVTLASRAAIGPNCVVRDSVIEEDAQILAGSVIDGAHVGRDCRVGPFARLRPGTVLAAGVQVGNFVEAKNAIIGSGTKANHLAYIGDAEIGSGCNVGAGTITCNYDGAEKHRTKMGDDVFIGSNATLVAPIEVGDGAFVAAGSTTTKAVPPGTLAVARGRQRNIEGWKRPKDRDEEG
jgi:bifunctional UDP-N-acetylglucosamine pyrophosphorylase/glucosamine-1-phosphate N-acetyltransferase